MQRRHALCLLAGAALFPRRVPAASLLAGDGRSTPRPVATPSDMTSRLAAARALQLDRLHAYAMAGVFPLNEDFEGVRVPYFLDAHGTACAVAWLMIQSGRRADVEAISRANNHVKVMDVHAGPMVDWVLSSGLLQEEAAQIQPSYGFERERDRRPMDPAIVELDRVRAHLLATETSLRSTTDASLPVALRRYEESLRG